MEKCLMLSLLRYQVYIESTRKEKKVKVRRKAAELLAVQVDVAKESWYYETHFSILSSVCVYLFLYCHEQEFLVLKEDLEGLDRLFK